MCRSTLKRMCASRPRRRLRSLVLGASLLVIGVAAGARAAEPWHYRLGERRADQQANFCKDRQTALALAEVFRRHGPRPGYTALEQAEDCTVAVSSFTPRKVIERVPISLGDGAQYTVSFVEVEMSGGAVSYLFTTREIKY